MRLYTHPFSIVPWRVRIALHEKGVEYESVKTDLYTQPVTAEFKALNPFAQIPVLEDDGFAIAESIAILEYLEEKYTSPALLPQEIRSRATVRKLMCWGTDYWPGAWKKWMAPRMPAGLGDEFTQASVEEGRAEMSAHRDVLEDQLTGRQWLVDEYSLADVCYAPFVLVLDRVELGDEITRRPNVNRWVEQLRARRSVIDTMMPPSS